jgi:hypothetical protein
MQKLPSYTLDRIEESPGEAMIGSPPKEYKRKTAPPNKRKVPK